MIAVFHRSSKGLQKHIWRGPEEKKREPTLDTKHPASTRAKRGVARFSRGIFDRRNSSKSEYKPVNYPVTYSRCLAAMLVDFRSAKSGGKGIPRRNRPTQTFYRKSVFFSGGGLWGVLKRKVHHKTAGVPPTFIVACLDIPPHV